MPLASGCDKAHVTRVSTSRALAWIVTGWTDTARNLPGSVLLTALLLAPVLLTVALLSLRCGSVLFSISIVFFLAFISVCHKRERGEALPRLRDQGTLARSKALWIVAAIAASATLTLDLLSNTMGLSTQAASWLGLGLYFLLVNLLKLLLLMALWLAPALIVLDGARPLQAMRLSLLATLRNLVPCCVFGLLAFVLCIVAVIPVGLGLLLALPTLASAAHLAWRDLFA